MGQILKKKSCNLTLGLKPRKRIRKGKKNESARRPDIFLKTASDNWTFDSI
jgi:hypothetical protein